MSDFKLSDKQRQILLKKSKKALIDIIEKNMDLIEGFDKLGSKKDVYIEGLKRESEIHKKLYDIVKEKEKYLHEQLDVLQEEFRTWKLLFLPTISPSNH